VVNATQSVCLSLCVYVSLMSVTVGLSHHLYTLTLISEQRLRFLPQISLIDSYCENE